MIGAMVAIVGRCRRSGTPGLPASQRSAPPTASFDITVGNQSPYTATAIEVIDYLPGVGMVKL